MIRLLTSRIVGIRTVRKLLSNVTQQNTPISVRISFSGTLLYLSEFEHSIFYFTTYFVNVHENSFQTVYMILNVVLLFWTKSTMVLKLENQGPNFFISLGLGLGQADWLILSIRSVAASRHAWVRVWDLGKVFITSGPDCVLYYITIMTYKTRRRFTPV